MHTKPTVGPATRWRRGAIAAFLSQPQTRPILAATLMAVAKAASRRVVRYIAWSAQDLSGSALAEEVHG